MTMNVRSFDPTEGPVGTIVTLDVTGMPAGASTSNVFVVLGDTPSAVLVQGVNLADGTVTVSVQNNAQSGQFSVVIGSDSATSAGVFTVQGGDADEPRISTVSPTAGRPSTMIRLQGRNLKQVRRVTLGSRSVIIEQHSDTSISFMIPAALPAGTYQIVAMSPDYPHILAPHMLTVMA